MDPTSQQRVHDEGGVDILFAVPPYITVDSMED